MTSFEKIFDIFMSETKHTSLSSLSEADLVYILEHYLETSALVEFKKCRKDLSKYTKTTYIRLVNGVPDIEEDKDEDEIDPDFSIEHHNLEENLEIPGEDFDNGMNVCPDEYPDEDFDSGMNVDPNNPFPEVPEWDEDKDFSVDFKITYEIDKIGYFEEDLAHEECYILALSMILHQLQTNVNREEYFKRTISDRDFKLSGGDKILASAMELEKSTRKKLKKYKTSYSYNYADELRSL